MLESKVGWVRRKKWDLLIGLTVLVLGGYGLFQGIKYNAQRRAEDALRNDNEITWFYIPENEWDIIHDMSDEEEKKFRESLERQYPHLKDQLELRQVVQGMYTFSVQDATANERASYLTEIISGAGLQDIFIPLKRK
ncbi:MAG: hypothetical protein ABIH34_02995 [Nanoarchaeota archaeon]